MGSSKNIIQNHKYIEELAPNDFVADQFAFAY